jgi:cyclophilin family peptidyl-prolyl cis-trans isomerase
MRSSVAIAGVLAVLASLTAGCSSNQSGSSFDVPVVTTASTASRTTGSASASPTDGCGFRPSPQDPAPPGKDVGLPPSGGTASSVLLRTSAGEIRIALAAGKAPCTARSFAHLAGKKFFDGSPCHRLTSNPALKVLQCGDPTGTGRGGPGYTLPDENPTGLPAGPSPEVVVYARGTVAMANTGAPHSGGSQFFIVYGDSTLPPTYAVFGTVDPAGLTVLDKIAAAGIDPSNGPDDGAPKTPVTIQQAVVAT